MTAPSPPSADELIERLHRTLRAGAPRRERKPGESIELGDEVHCDILTVVDARVVPGGVQHDARLEMREYLHLPGFVEQVLSMTCFSAKSFELPLPADYPAKELAGKQASSLESDLSSCQADKRRKEADEARRREEQRRRDESRHGGGSGGHRDGSNHGGGSGGHRGGSKWG